MSHQPDYERLPAGKRGKLPWSELDAWRKELHRNFERALAETKLPERPDYEAANRFLSKLGQIGFGLTSGS